MSSADSTPVKSDRQLLDSNTTDAVSDSSTVNLKANPDQQISESAGEEGEGEGDEEEEEEEGECGFCLFMKGGGCKDAFTAWEDCIEEAKDKTYVDKCSAVTFALRECMKSHADYYEPILRVEEEALRELEKEKEAHGSSQDSEANVGTKDLKPESGGQ